MDIKSHGGGCCGIAHIHGFTDPDIVMSSLPAVTNENRSHWPNRWIHTEIPAETVLQRFDRYLRYVDNLCPSTLVEVALTENQTERWKKILEERGFKVVSSFVNSNSGNVVNVFHRNTDIRKGPHDFKKVSEAEELLLTEVQTAEEPLLTAF